ncbi:hypothetical protein FSP39_023537 [Pinctada imbricata]|uniref:C2 domain-containing protein n=1 Tax=Pinctada imbricata TaxID=66713 RepID=A0AA88YGH5_PINIB|nr:hypothetical protein FSP39_023537 [Pinctada imbricata]
MTTALNPSLVSLAGSKVEVLVSCTDLADLDEFTKTDPMCVLFIKQFGQWKEYGRTEAIQNSLNPKFVSSFIIEFEPSVTQQLMFSVYDIDSRSQDLKHHDFVGSSEDTLLNLVDETKMIKTTTKNLRVPSVSKPRGLINITTEIIKDSRNKVRVHAGSNKLDKKGIFSLNKPDTYLEIGRSIENVTYHPVYRTETVMKSTSPRWRPFEISVQRLCNTDWDRNIQFSVYHFSGSNYHLIGRKVTTLREMHNTPIVDIQYSMLDFVRGGMQLNQIVAIDFTISNGHIDDELSLHNVTDARDNQYLDAIETLGSMISQYSIDPNIAAFGFGANWKDKEKVSHCFPLTRDKNNIYLKGIKSLQDCYESVLPQLKFSGPTKVSHVIEKAAAIAERENTSQQKQSYTVLLVITVNLVLCYNYNVLETPLKHEKTGKVADRSNTCFVAFRRETAATGGNLAHNLNIKSVIKDISGKPMLALEVFKAVIVYLMDHFFVHHFDHVDMVPEENIHWLISVPSIWEDAARQFMRLAAEKAGIPGRQLHLACEAESASLYCHRQINSGIEVTSVGTTYMIINCGGGILDISVHKVGNGGKLTEVHPSTGGAWGSTSVVADFFSFLSEIFGTDLYQTLSPSEILKLEVEFEDVMKQLSHGSPALSSSGFCFDIPESLLKPLGLVHKNGYSISLHGRQLFIGIQTMLEIFKPTLDSIIRCVRSVLNDRRSQSIRYVIMVGGFSKCAILQSSLKQVFSLVKFIVPDDVMTPTVKGAVLFGNNPNIVNLRIAPRSYGIRKQCRFVHGKHDARRLEIIDGVEKCTDIFDVYIQKDETLLKEHVTEYKTYCPVRHDQTVMRLRVYSADKRSPHYTTDPGCRKIGHIVVQLPDTSKGKSRQVRVKMIVGGTELKVSAVDDDTGKKFSAKFDFLHNI